MGGVVLQQDTVPDVQDSERIMPGDVVVISDNDVKVYRGLTAHEFIRIEIMARHGGMERDSFSDRIKRGK